MKDTELIKYANNNPNLTVLLPGKCNAKCDFCFWNRDFGKDKVTGFVAKAMKHIERMPSRFRTLSISGGEPTLSPAFIPFLKALTQYQRATGRFERVVLTTNGVKLESLLVAVAQVVNHINISRHHFDDEKNQEVFGTSSVPSSGDLKILLSKVKLTGMDVTFNCVISDDRKFSPKKLYERITFCENYIKWASKLGAVAVSFRKEASTVKPTIAERHFRRDYGLVSEDSCPVCRGAVQDVKGFEVRWKGSVAEPSIKMNAIYEAIIHADGKLYLDWSRQMPFPRKKFIDDGVRIINPKNIGKELIEACGRYPSSDRFYEYMTRGSKVGAGCGGRGVAGCGTGGSSGKSCGTGGRC